VERERHVREQRKDEKQRQANKKGNALHPTLIISLMMQGWCNLLDGSPKLSLEMDQVGFDRGKILNSFLWFSWFLNALKKRILKQLMM
jgi:hypothetical protein